MKVQPGPGAPGGLRRAWPCAVTVPRGEGRVRESGSAARMDPAPCGWSQPWPCHPSASVTRCEADLAPP